MTRPTVAVIGVGHWHADIHLQAFGRAGAEVVAVSDDDGDLAARVGHSVSAASYDSHHVLLDRHSVDLAIVLGRHDRLPALAVDVARQGQDFVLEKPCAVSGAALAPAVEAVRQSGVHAAVALANRLRPVWEHVQHIGAIRFAHIRMVSGPPERYVEWSVPWVLDQRRSGGGAMRNLGIHTVDAFLSLTAGEPVEVLSAATQEAIGFDVEDRAVALLQSGAILGLVEAAYTLPSAATPDVEWRIEGSLGYLRDRNDVLEIHDSSGTHRVDLSASAGRYEVFAADALRRVRNGEGPLATLADAARALEVIDQIYATANGERRA